MLLNYNNIKYHNITFQKKKSLLFFKIKYVTLSIYYYKVQSIHLIFY